jgi:hypothetical protein
MDKLGIVFSGRVRSASLCVLALWILLRLVTGGAEIMGSYLAGGGFDTPIRSVVWIDLTIFLPYFIVAAVFLRSLAARLALFHRLRRQIVVPEYSPPEVLSPAEAGLLVDNDFTFNEIAGTLKDLELRGCVTITEKAHEFTMLPKNIENATQDELLFLETLWHENGEFSTNTPGSGRILLDAGRDLATATRQKLVEGGQLPASRAVHKIVRSVVKMFIIFALLVQAMLTYAVITNPHQVFSIGYPRYPMSFIEPTLEVLAEILVLVIVLSGFRQRSLADDHGLKNWRYVAGLRMFIEKAYKDRFYRDGQQMASEGDMRTFYPYAIALGVEKRFAKKLKASLIF